MNTMTNRVNEPGLKRMTGALKAPIMMKLIRAECPGDFDGKELAEIEEIHRRAETMTPLLRKILNICPRTHWGINE